MLLRKHFRFWHWTKVVFHSVLQSCYIKKIVERGVLGFRKSIWPDSVFSIRGAGHLTPKKSLGRGAFDQRKSPHGGEFDQKKQKMSNAQGSARGGDGHSWIWLIHNVEYILGNLLYLGISVLAGSQWDSTIIPDYENIKSRIRLFIFGFSSTCGKARVRLYIASCFCRCYI